MVLFVLVRIFYLSYDGKQQRIYEPLFCLEVGAAGIFGKTLSAYLYASSAVGFWNTYHNECNESAIERKGEDYYERKFGNAF